MKIESLTEWDKRLNGSSLQGYIHGEYDDLVESFGEPTLETDEYKTDAEWILDFGDDLLITIYNYKNGKNYLGADGLNVRDIKHWHVGGKGPRGLFKLDEYFEENGIRLSTELDRLYHG